jgi:hypothetical protein
MKVRRKGARSGFGIWGFSFVAAYMPSQKVPFVTATNPSQNLRDAVTKRAFCDGK